MAFTITYMNGFDLGTGFGPFLPYVPSAGIAATQIAVQYSLLTGYQSGKGIWLNNTGFREANMSLPVGEVYPRVLFRCYFKPHNSGSDPAFDRVTFLRFERGDNGIIINLRRRTDGRIEITKGGTGRNNSGTVLLVLDQIFALDQWYGLEVRADATAGTFTVWIDDMQAGEVTGQTFGAGFDRVTLRWEVLGGRGIIWDHIAVAKDSSTAKNRLGPCLVTSYQPESDQVNGGWAPNTGSVKYSLLADGLTARKAPDKTATYVSGIATTALDLYGIPKPDCFGFVWAMALNLGGIGIGAPMTVQGTIRTLGGTVAAADMTFSDVVPHDSFSDQLPVKQNVWTLNPQTGQPWSDTELRRTLYGFRGSAGSARVSMLYVEKLTSLLDTLDFNCGGRGSYSYVEK